MCILDEITSHSIFRIVEWYRFLIHDLIGSSEQNFLTLNYKEEEYKFLFIFPLILSFFKAGHAEAEIQPEGQAFCIYAGAFFGDDLTDQSILGSQPELDDAFVLGINYLYFPTFAFGLSPRYTFVPSGVKNTPGRGVYECLPV